MEELISRSWIKLTDTYLSFATFRVGGITGSISGIDFRGPTTGLLPPGSNGSFEAEFSIISSW